MRRGWWAWEDERGGKWWKKATGERTRERVRRNRWNRIPGQTSFFDTTRFKSSPRGLPAIFAKKPPFEAGQKNHRYFIGTFNRLCLFDRAEIVSIPVASLSLRVIDPSIDYPVSEGRIARETRLNRFQSSLLSNLLKNKTTILFSFFFLSLLPGKSCISRFVSDRWNSWSVTSRKNLFSRYCAAFWKIELLVYGVRVYTDRVYTRSDTSISLFLYFVRTKRNEETLRRCWLILDNEKLGKRNF